MLLSADVERGPTGGNLIADVDRRDKEMQIKLIDKWFSNYEK